MKIRWIRELFSFSAKERTGIITLLCIIFLLLLIGKLIPLFIPTDNTDFSKWEAEVDAYLANAGPGNSSLNRLHPVVFNPNEVDSVTLITFGLPPKVIGNWLKYLAKGGRFRNKDGVKKIFGMTPGMFDQLDSFMVIPRAVADPKVTSDHMKMVKTDIGRKTLSNMPPDFGFREKKPVMVMELNSSDSATLVEIPGIGPVLASRIIKYRNLLGGYYDVSQLREVYGIREENFMTVSPYVTVDPSVVRTFNINFATVQELGRHPYVGFRTARKVFKLRDKMGKFSSAGDLSTVVGEDTLKRLLPYVKFNQ